MPKSALSNRQLLELEEIIQERIDDATGELLARMTTVEARFPRNARTSAVEGHVHGVPVQDGAGVPTHIARESTLYWDTTNNKLHINSSGSTVWTEIGGLTGPQGTAGGAQMILQWSEGAPARDEGPAVPQLNVGTLEHSMWLNSNGTFQAPIAGTIVAVFVGNDGQVATTGGTYKVEAYKNQAITGLTATMDGTTNTLSAYATGSVPFVQEDLLGIRFTTDNFAPISANQYMGIILDFGGGAAAHSILDGDIHTDSLAGTVVRGDLIVGNSTPAHSRLGIGAANQVLTSDGTDVSWAAPAATVPFVIYIPLGSDRVGQTHLPV